VNDEKKATEGRKIEDGVKAHGKWLFLVVRGSK
jgi:hypothetical protein